MNTAGDTMTPVVIMDVATIEDALDSENENHGKAVEAPPPGDLTMQQLSRILVEDDALKDCIAENENCSVCITEMMHQLNSDALLYRPALKKSE